ncbi:hypothetical protein HN777_00680 [Candidatus Woesearchaeota archaeon]|jgi:hypothetical protein|nr:hypothetical protein [Candidatus Woesearchaeota archaeon]MBT7402287.1 hypothetical protein [Candidatus Woesearchaeota archaeon]
MAFIDESEHWIVACVGLIFLIVGSSKWIYDVIIINNFAHWKVYMVMMLIGAVMTGYMKLEKLAEKALGRVKIS